jgi:hypothetical protein
MASSGRTLILNTSNFRKCQVSGVDELDDVLTFGTNDRLRVV